MIIVHKLSFILVLLAGCSFTHVEPIAQLPTATTLRVVQTTSVPTLDRDLQAVEGAADSTEQPPTTESAGATSDDDETCQSTAGELTQHTVNARIDYQTHSAAVEQNVRYINHTNDTLTQIVLNVEANYRPGTFTLDGVAIQGESGLTYELTGRRLTVELPRPLEPGCTVSLHMTFRLAVPNILAGSIDAYRGFLGYTPRQMNMGHWLPTVAVYMNSEWITRDATFIGEQVVLDQADWDVSIEVSGASESLMVAGPGLATNIGSRSWHFEQQGGRDFTVSLSEEFNVTRQLLDNGVTVEVYSFDDAVIATDNGPQDGAAFALVHASRSLAMYSDLFGEFPYPRMVVVQGDFPDGMEFSGIVFVSGDWFRSFTGSAASYLMLITVHEVSHQWWYARVGSDSALNPWLDEALATYSEYIFIEEYYPDLKEWWWTFRVDPYNPQGFVDETVYEFSSIREYINAVYLRGVRMLDALRNDIGTEAFFAWLRRYAEAGAGRVVTPDLIWSLLTQEQLEATQATRQLYLRDAGL